MTSIRIYTISILVLAIAALSNAAEPVAASASSRPRVTQQVVSGDYRIGAGDVLQITVWKEPDASVAGAVVRPDGKITLPLLKEVEVAGLTPAKAEQLITQRLSTLIRDPDVTVVISAANSSKAYVVGAVRKEGPVTLNSQMTVLQVLIEAGGLTEFAKKKHIYVLRMDNGAPRRFPFDYDSVIKGRNLGQNIPVVAGDTIVVPQ